VNRAVDIFFHKLRAANTVVLGIPKASDTPHIREVPLLDAVFEICVNPTIAEEELLAKATGLTLPQVGVWCKWY
jgi:hypothetical protein